MSYLSRLAGFGLPEAQLNYIYRSVLKGLSANKIQSLLKQSVFGGLRRQTVQTVVRAARDEISAGPLTQAQAERKARLFIIPRSSNRKYISFIGGDRSFNIAKLKISPYAHRKDLNYIIEIQGTHPFSGDRVVQKVTVVSNTQLTKNEAIVIAMDNLDTDRYRIKDITTVKVTDVLLGGKYKL